MYYNRHIGTGIIGGMLVQVLLLGLLTAQQFSLTASNGNFLRVRKCIYSKIILSSEYSFKTATFVFFTL